jgi:hypothetical protein
MQTLKTPSGTALLGLSLIRSLPTLSAEDIRKAVEGFHRDLGGTSIYISLECSAPPFDAPDQNVFPSA